MGRWLAKLPNGLPSVISRLGIAIPPNVESSFDLQGIVVPVVLAEDLTIQASPAIFTNNQTQGVVAAAGAGTVLADTGALAFGSYLVQGWFWHTDGAIRRFEIQQRNDANAANDWVSVIAFGDPSGTVRPQQFEFTWTITANERFRIVNQTAVVNDAWAMLFWRSLP